MRPHAFADNAVPGCRQIIFGGEGVRASRRFRHVAHLVREPLSSINSRYNMGNISAFRRPSRCFTTAGAGSTLAQTLQHYVLWNSFVEASSRFHLPLEQLTAPWLRALLTFGELPIHHSDEEIERAIAALKARHVNSHHTAKGPALSWKQLHLVDSKFAILAQLLALRHGYTIRDDELLSHRNASTVPQQHCGLRPTHPPNDATAVTYGRWDCWLVWETAKGHA